MTAALKGSDLRRLSASDARKLFQKVDLTKRSQWDGFGYFPETQPAPLA